MLILGVMVPLKSIHMLDEITQLTYITFAQVN